jgi:hypothetical protein
MPNMKPEQTQVSVVLLGKFHTPDFELPAISASGALGAAEQNMSTYEALLRNQVSQILLPWGKLTALVDRLQVEVTQVPYVRGVDLVLKLMHDVSVASLVNKFGINLTAHYRFDDISARDNFAKRLVPPSAWGSFGSTVEKSFGEKHDLHGGLMRVTMRQARPDERPAGWIDVTVEPSALIGGDQGVSITVNDHYEPAGDVNPEGTKRRAISEQFLSLLEENFDESVERSLRICDDILGN